MNEVMEALSASGGGRTGSDRLLIMEILRESDKRPGGGMGVVDREEGPGVSVNGVDAPMPSEGARGADK